MKRDSIRLLLADDDHDDRLFFEEALEELPLTVQLTTVNDGEQLMHHLEKEFESLLPENCFVRVHRSDMINIDFIVRLL